MMHRMKRSGPPGKRRPAPGKSSPPPAPPQSLDGMRHRLLDGLTRGARDSRHPFHRPALATVNRLGHPEVRTVVLREFNRDSLNLFFYTDSRSPKVKELGDQPEAVWLFYDPRHQLQLRVTTRCKRYRSDEMKDPRWRRLSDAQKRDYRGLHAPGHAMDGPRAADPPARPEPRFGYEHFCLIGGKVVRADVLFLLREGHLRAQFDFTKADAPGSWVAP